MLWDDFINSYWRNWRTGDRSTDVDKLADPEWISGWLSKHQLQSALPNRAEIELLRALRACLWTMVQQVVDGVWPDRAMLEQLNTYLAKGPVNRQIVWSSAEQASITQLPLRQDWDQVQAEIAASFATALLEKEPSRFRICENPDCLWVYYDDTRNRSKRYCDDKACGNLMKVRRFRARKKAEAHERLNER